MFDLLMNVSGKDGIGKVEFMEVLPVVHGVLLRNDKMPVSLAGGVGIVTLFPRPRKEPIGRLQISFILRPF